ncbi:MAG TPA: hypothetical protein VFY71_07765 [Planctomycetota bacterium]|nr:hypothetical protein [Planctomycetota bacterium]
MRRAAALLATVLLLAPADPAPQVVDLAGAAWTRDGRAPDAAPPVLSAPDTPSLVELSFPKPGTRWACEFSTDEAATCRLALSWQGGPEGLLFEVVLDGQRLSPPRDGWRPTRRGLRSDLGSVWVGRGAHLLEFVAREKPPAPPARLRLAALELGEP